MSRPDTEAANRIGRFRLGYKDGASGLSALTRPELRESPDYIDGLNQGRRQANDAVLDFCIANGLPLPSPTR